MRPAGLAVAPGVLLFPLALVAGQLVCELFGAHRAGMLALAGDAACLATAMFALATGASVVPIALALALVVYAIVAHAVAAVAFAIATHARRRAWMSSLIAIAIAQAIAWAAFLLVTAVAGAALGPALSFAAAAALATCAIAVAAMVPWAIARTALGVFLRVGRDASAAIDHELLPAGTAWPPGLPPALIVEDEPTILRRPARAAIQQAFTVSELNFFAEGDVITSPAR